MRFPRPVQLLLACSFVSLAAVLAAADDRPAAGETQVASPNGAGRLKLLPQVRRRPSQRSWPAVAAPPFP